MSRPIRLLDTTLRDGSYEVSFQFTLEDTALLVSALNRAGVSYIELCHGSGFAFDRYTAKRGLRNRSAHVDEAHLEVAAASAEHAHVGIVFVVEKGYGTPEDLALVARLGAKFVRLILPPGDLFDEHALSFIPLGKKLGLTVSINVMQSYSIPATELARGAKICAERGADWFYVVDSAGGMSGAEVSEYVRAVHDASGLIVGLHAHNNLGLATANCLAAIDAGATMVDATLQGMGRNTGNPSTEQLLIALQRLGHEPKIDRDLVFSMGDLIRTTMTTPGNDPTDFVFGAVRIPWKQVPALVERARKAGRAEREFLFNAGAAAAARDILAMGTYPPDLIEEALAKSPSVSARPVPAPLLKQISAGITRASARGLDAVCDELTVRAGKRGKRTALHLAPRAQVAFGGPMSWEDGEHVGTTLGVDHAVDWSKVAADRWPAVIVLDPSLAAPPAPPTTLVARERHAPLELEAAADLAAASGMGTVIACAPPAARDALAARGLPVASVRAGAEPVAWVVAQGGELDLRRGNLVVLLGGEAHADAVARAKAVGAKVLRPALGAVVAARVARIEAAADALAGDAAVEQDGLSLVTPSGAHGRDQVVVDNLDAPTRIVDAGRHDPADVANRLAARRAQALMRGKGNL